MCKKKPEKREREGTDAGEGVKKAKAKEETSVEEAEKVCLRVAQAPPCPVDFQVDAPCRIIKIGGGTVKITASDMGGFAGGTFTWSTTSAKIALSNVNGSEVTVTSHNATSAGRDAEVVKVKRTAVGCPDIEKTVALTVAKVTFSASVNQRYGYDDFDTPANPLDDHICIKQSDYTFLKVTIEGGAQGTDFDFVCDNNAVCTSVAPAAAAQFDLRLDAGNGTKDNSTLHAKAKCPAATSFSQIEVHVYKERVVKVVVAKIDHPTQANRSLLLPNEDYASHAATANAKLKEAVVKYDITNFRPDNGITPVAFSSGTGVLHFDIAKGGGPDLVAIRAAMGAAGTKVRVAIIRDMKSFYYLSAAAAKGATTLTVTAANVFYTPGRTRLPLELGLGAKHETLTISAVNGNTITCSPLQFDHPINEPIERKTAGWSTDPILIIEGAGNATVIKWTILHEVGHRGEGLTLADIVDDTDFMHFEQAWTDYRLRYCPRTRHYDPPGGTENQWETIPRT